MTIPSAAGAHSAGATSKKPIPPAFPDFVTFANRWLFPFQTVRLAEANREQTYTWCAQWWRHRPVSVRIAHLHTAFEVSRRSQSGSAISAFILGHIDAHTRVILDAANGPLHRCTRTKHIALHPLSADPVPPGWFGKPRPVKPIANQKAKKPPRFAHYSDFVNNWLLPVTAVRVAANHREGQYTWCRQWWAHHGVAVRFAAIHAVFEAARTAEDKTAMSTLFVAHIDPHMRSILDAAQGPLHRCTPERHVPQPGLPAVEPPAGWFVPSTIGGASEELGFGPDFRLLRT